MYQCQYDQQPAGTCIADKKAPHRKHQYYNGHINGAEMDIAIQGLFIIQDTVKGQSCQKNNMYKKKPNSELRQPFGNFQLPSLF